MDKWFRKIKEAGREQILILLLCGVLLLVIAIPSGDGRSGASEKTQTAQETPARAAEADGSPDAEEGGLSEAQRLESHLKELLCQVEGIGRVDVMLTLRSDGRKILEKDIEESRGKEEDQGEGTAAASEQVSSSENTVFQRDAQGNELPYVTEELEPEVAGVLVIAQGAGNASVVREITDAVMALFGVEAHKIKVMKMK